MDLSIGQLNVRTCLDKADSPCPGNKKVMWAQCGICGKKIEGFDKLKDQHYFKNVDHFVCDSCIVDRVIDNSTVVRIGDKIIFVSVL